MSTSTSTGRERKAGGAGRKAKKRKRGQARVDQGAGTSSSNAFPPTPTSSNPPIVETDGEGAILALVQGTCADAIEEIQQNSTGERLQAIKMNFYKRNYEAVFSEPSNLPIYAAYYVPARALCYYDILTKNHAIFAEVFCPSDPQKWPTKKGRRRKVTAHFVGGGPGSELIGFSRFVHDVFASRASKISTTLSSKQSLWPPRPHLLTHDSKDFSSLFERKGGYSEAVQAWFSNHTVGPEGKMWRRSYPTCSFHVNNALQATEETVGKFGKANILTFCFVVAELFKADPKATMKLFSTLKTMMKCGALLLIMDSAGTFSFVETQKSDPRSKRWTYDVMDELFLQKTGISGGCDNRSRNIPGSAVWKRVASSNSEWYRVSSEIRKRYPLKIQNMRYFYRVYQKMS